MEVSLFLIQKFLIFLENDKTILEREPFQKTIKIKRARGLQTLRILAMYGYTKR